MTLVVGSAAAALLGMIFSGVTAPAAASPGQDEAAQQAFRAGVEAARQEQWTDARTMFEKAYGLSPRPVVLINLAGAQARTGRLTEAAKNYHRILDDEPSQETASFRRAAAEVLPSLEARIPRVKLRPSGLSPTDVIRIDGDVVETATLADGHPLDPGEHTLVVAHGGTERARVLFTLAERESREISLPLPVVVPPQGDASPAGPALDPPTARDVPEDRRRWWSSPWTWAAVAAVVVGASAVTYVLLSRDDTGCAGNIPPGCISVR
ncbi:MAG: hypothetical protein ABUL77_02460 [Bacteroidota bacterium]